MARIFSWKLNDYKYAYLYIPNKPGRHVSDRITNEDIIRDMVKVVDRWTDDEYITNYEELSSEAARLCGVTMPACNESMYKDVSDSVVFLSGKDGTGGSGGNGGNGGGTTPSAEELENYINEVISAATQHLKDENEAIAGYIASAANQEVKDMISRLQDADNALNDAMDKLQDDMEQNQEAMDYFRTLAGSDVTPEQIISGFAMTAEGRRWLEEVSGNMTTILADYDDAIKSYGMLGSSVNASHGYFSVLGECINGISGTLGTVGAKFDAASGLIENFATWFDESGGTMTEITHWLNASAGTLGNMLAYYDENGGFESLIEQVFNAHSGTIIQQITTNNEEGFNALREEWNAMSGTIKTFIDNYTPGEGGDTGDWTSIQQQLNALSARVNTTIDAITSGRSELNRVSQELSAANGILQTVSHLSAERDENGNIRLFYLSGETEIEVVEKEITTVIPGEGSQTKIVYVNKSDNTVVTDDPKLVYAHYYMPDMYSYIHQTVSSITLSVVSGSLNAGIDVYISKNSGTLISMIADKVVIDADVIAKALSAKTANIGGVAIGSGAVESLDGYYRLDASGLTANKGNIAGFELNGHVLQAKNELGTVSSILNASELYTDTNHGKIIFATGTYNTEGNTSETQDFNAYVWQISGKTAAGRYRNMEIALAKYGYYTLITPDTYAAGTEETNVMAFAYRPKNISARMKSDGSFTIHNNRAVFDYVDSNGETRDAYFIEGAFYGTSDGYQPLDVAYEIDVTTKFNSVKASFLYDAAEWSKMEDLDLETVLNPQQQSRVLGIGMSTTGGYKPDDLGLNNNGQMQPTTATTTDTGITITTGEGYWVISGGIKDDTGGDGEDSGGSGGSGGEGGSGTGGTGAAVGTWEFDSTKTLLGICFDEILFFKRTGETMSVGDADIAAFFKMAGTRIYEDGTLYTSQLYAEEGFFNGNIDAGGLFRGELATYGGTLSMPTLLSPVIKESVTLQNGADLIVNNSNGGVICNITNNSLSSLGVTSTAATSTNTTTTETITSNITSFDTGKIQGDKKETTYKREGVVLSDVICKGEGLSAITIPPIAWEYGYESKNVKTNIYCELQLQNGQSYSYVIISSTAKTGQTADAKITKDSNTAFTSDFPNIKRVILKFDYTLTIPGHGFLASTKHGKFRIYLPSQAQSQKMAMIYTKTQTATSGALIKAPEGVTIAKDGCVIKFGSGGLLITSGGVVTMNPKT